MRTVYWILMILFVASVAAASFFGITTVREAAGVQAAKTEKELKLDKTRAELYDANIKYRGFLDSADQVPDSLRVLETGRMMKMQQEHHKQIWRLERKERELTRLIRKHEQEIAAIRDRHKRRIYAFSAAALAFLVASLIARKFAIRS